MALFVRQVHTSFPGTRHDHVLTGPFHGAAFPMKYLLKVMPPQPAPPWPSAGHTVARVWHRVCAYEEQLAAGLALVPRQCPGSALTQWGVRGESSVGQV